MRLTGGGRRLVLIACVAAGSALALGACGPPGTGASFVEPLPRPSLTSPARIEPGTTSALYSIGLSALNAQRSADPVANPVVSPVGTSAMLAQIALGTRGPALDELESALGAEANAISDQYGQVWALWTPWAGDPTEVSGKKAPDEPVVALNSRIVVDDQMHPEQTWTDALARTWGTPVDQVDLQSSGAQRDLDRWASSASGGLVPESGIELSTDSRLVGQNAVVFGAAWKTPFDHDDTGPQTFTRADGTQVTTDMMSQSSLLAMSTTGGWTTVTLPYDDEDLVACLLMPDDPNAELDPGSVHTALELADESDEEYVSVRVPKVRTQGEQNLQSTFADLGLVGLVKNTADLSGIGTTDDGPLELNQTASQTVLRMDEEGTVAAAVNEFEMEGVSGVSGVPSRVIAFDHPYLVVLADQDTRTPLFMAWVSDPSRGDH